MTRSKYVNKSSAIGKPLAMYKDPYEAVIQDNPRPKVMILTEVDVMHPKPCSVLVKLHRQSDDFMAQASVSYQYILQCSFCLSPQHHVCSCQTLQDMFSIKETLPNQGAESLNLVPIEMNLQNQPLLAQSTMIGNECQSTLRPMPRDLTNYDYAGLQRGNADHGAQIEQDMAMEDPITQVVDITEERQPQKLQELEVDAGPHEQRRPGRGAQNTNTMADVHDAGQTQKRILLDGGGQINGDDN